FARAHNQAIELALSRWQGEDLKTRYIMVANPDLEFAPSALRVIIAFMDANPEIAACGPKLLRIFLRPDSHNEEYETTRSNIIDSTGLTINKMRRVYDRGAGEVDEGQYNETEPVFGISGACTIFRASNLLEAKLGNEFYDEDFFAYKEDVDMAWRIQRLGFNTFYVPQAIVWHHRRAPSDPGASWFKAWRERRNKSPLVNYLSSRNHSWVAIKNDEILNSILHLPWWASYEIMKTFANLFSPSSLKGQFVSLVGVPKMIKKRSELNRRVKRQGRNIRRWFI
ncbi:glycosyltransferase, partial [Patescibacteria group bacterium]|nr:glycosyltransferase [Patescibacteria group bacterium]